MSSDEEEDNRRKKSSALEKKRKKTLSQSMKSKKFRASLIDDAAELSGEDDGDDDEDDDDDEDLNEYVKDGFIVDDEEEHNRTGELEDSDEEGDDDDDDDDDNVPKVKRTKGRVRKMRSLDRLDEDDLALIQEASSRKDEAEARRRREAEASRRVAVVAHNEAELRKGLFYESEEDISAPPRQPPPSKKPLARVERYDEDGMDDFIDDDIGDQGDIMASDKRNRSDDDGRGVVSEAQLTEASEIFGTDYMDFMDDQQEDEDGDEDILGAKYRERGVGVDYGVDSEDDMISEEEEEDDDDLFGDDDDLDQDATGQTARQRAEALRLKREKREMAKTERRRQARLKKAEKRKARLRRAFEPVQLIENFCTDRDDEIRMRDAPERFFDWTTPFHGPPDGTAKIGDEEEEEALWIMGRIPAIAVEFFSPPPVLLHNEDLATTVEKKQQSILDSIAFALRYMHRDKLEPDFIKRYRADNVTSVAVRENLYSIMDEDGEWERMTHARSKVEAILGKITSASEGDEAKGAEEENIHKLKEDLQVAQGQLDEALKQETAIKNQLKDFGDMDIEDEDEDLFGKDDDEEEDEELKAKKAQKTIVESHLSTVQSLLQARAERVAQVASMLKASETRNTASLHSQGPALQITKKICRPCLWNTADYKQYLSSLTDVRQILDMNGYLALIKEGNDAIRQKETPNGDDGGTGKNSRKRSRRFNRDFYRTCVSEGLRAICYRFMLPPFRAGIKLEDTSTTGTFSFNKTLPGEEDSDSGDPLKWISPVFHDVPPDQFARDLIGSGELVLLSTLPESDDRDSSDPLRGCRYVAAMELAYEPRIRGHLRAIFRDRALLTTCPTKKGMDAIDCFHDYYGLHLIKDKLVKEHFPMDEKESDQRKAGLGIEERKELDAEMKKRERDSCLQYLNILKAEQTGDINVLVHLPFIRSNDEDWYKHDVAKMKSRDSQDMSLLMAELEKVYLPIDGDTDAWNDERRKILRFALTNFILPQFEAETRREMREAATKVGVVAAAENLHTMALEGPYRPAALLGENRFLVPTGDLPIVGVCCASDGRDATYLASVTLRGELNDHLAVPSGNRVDGDNMREKVVTFLMHSRPAAVVVGTGGGLESRLLARKLGDLLTQAIDRWNNRFIQGQDEDDDEFELRQKALRESHAMEDFEDEEVWKCNIDLVDDSVAQLFGRSVRGKKEFPDVDVNLRCAIATARHAKDPLAELTYAWSVASDAGVFGTEMLFLNIHPMQQLLPRTLLLRQYERVLCNAVADVGVDVNTACTFDHLHGLLSFVPGLGPRKAANLKQNIVRIGGVVASRRALLAKRLMGPIVYNNAVAFLRIREIEQLTNQFLHPLDDTRLHPDVYHRNNWAVKIAIDALERLEDDGKGADKDAVAIKALRDVIDDSAREVRRLFKATKAEWESHYGPTFNVPSWDPKVNVPSDQWRDKVEELDLDAFAEMIAQSGQGQWHSHLLMIKWEFRLPFEDPRKPMEPLTGDKLFRLLTGETDQSLRPGKEVTGKVVRNGEFGSRVKLDGDIPAFIPLRNLADEHVETAEDVVTVGSVVTAVVTNVKKDHMCVDMSLRMEDFRKPQTSWERPLSLPQLDLHFDRNAAVKIEQDKGKAREAHLASLQLSFGATRIGDDGENGDKPRRRNGRASRRACAHPAFRNAKHDEVDRELREAGDALVGEALIRPSSKSPDSLAVHWVVRPGVIKIIEVSEEDKDTDASIGNILKIKNEVYGSLDELLGRYIAPMNDFVEELTHHRKFIDLAEDDVDSKLREEKRATPSGVFYYLCWNELYAGYASLRFIMSATPRNHPVGISPRGFLWGAKTFPNVDKLLNEFKKNPRGSATTSIRSTTSSVSSRATSIPSKIAEIKPSRWGSKPPAPSAPPPAPSGWGPPPPMQPVPAAQSGWGAPAATAATGGWGQPPPPHHPPPPSLPPPPPPGNFQPPPPPGPPPPFGRPPPYGLPPPPGPPQGYGQPPPPPGNYQYQQPPAGYVPR